MTNTRDATNYKMAERIRAHLFKVCSGSTQEMTGKEARLIIEEMMTETGASSGDLRVFWESTHKFLGPFRDLPESMQKGLSVAAHYTFLEFRQVSPTIVKRVVYNAISRLGESTVGYGWRFWRGGGRKTGILLIRIGRKIMWICSLTGHWISSRLRYSRIYRSPFLCALWKYVGCDAFSIIEEYIQDIPTDLRISPVCRDQANRIESCLLIGLDAVMHEGVLYFVESNMNPGFGPTQREAFPDEDPVCAGIVDYAVENGYHNVDFYASNHPVLEFQDKSFFALDVEQAWQATAAKKGIKLEVVDSPTRGSPYVRRRNEFTDLDSVRTLIVNSRDIPSPISRIIGTKGRLDQLIKNHNERLPTDQRIGMPKQIECVKDLRSIDSESRFPNVIAKQIHVDRAEGISLYKVSTLPDGLPNHSTKLYEYVVPDRVGGDNGAEGDEFVFKFRIYLMITAMGPRFVGSRKDVSRVPIPPALGEGKVPDCSPYISNVSIGSIPNAPTTHEEEACRRFALVIGDCVHGRLEEKYLMPSGPMPPQKNL